MDYVAKQKDAADKIRAKGAAATITQSAGGEYDPSISNLSPATVKTFPTAAVISSYSTREQDGRHVVRGDLRLMIPACDGFTPQEGDLITIPAIGSAFRVIATDPFSPGGVPVYYRVQVRR